jgi:hypothetical protein
MHYQDGTEIKIGDLARSVSSPESTKHVTTTEFMGTVSGGTPTADSCNVNLRVVACREVGPLGAGPWTAVTLHWSQMVNGSDLVCVTRAEAAVAVAA